MKTTSLLQSAAILAAVSLLTLSSAQAGMGPCMAVSSSSAPACANSAETQPACPRQAGPQGSGCVIGTAEMASMAAGGMQIATNVMRVLIDQASQVVGHGM